VSTPSTEEPTPPPPQPRRYRAAAVGYRDHDGGPRKLRVDIEDGTETVLSMTPAEAALLAVDLVAAAHEARLEERATEPGL
jgi:hypothetical protein